MWLQDELIHWSKFTGTHARLSAVAVDKLSRVFIATQRKISLREFKTHSTRTGSVFTNKTL